MVEMVLRFILVVVVPKALFTAKGDIMMAFLLKFLKAHPDQAIVILQQVLDVVKSDPELMAEVIKAIEGLNV